MFSNPWPCDSKVKKPTPFGHENTSIMKDHNKFYGEMHTGRNIIKILFKLGLFVCLDTYKRNHQKNVYTFTRNKPAIFVFVYLSEGVNPYKPIKKESVCYSQLLNLLHSKKPRLYTILAFLSAIGFKEK